MCGENFSQSRWIRALGSKNLRNYHLFIFGRDLSTIYLDRSDSNVLLGRIHIKKRSEPLRSPLYRTESLTGRNFQTVRLCRTERYKFGKMSGCWVLLKLNLLVLLLGEKVCQGPWMHICKWDCTSRTWYWKLLIARHLLLGRLTHYWPIDGSTFANSSSFIERKQITSNIWVFVYVYVIFC